VTTKGLLLTALLAFSCTLPARAAGGTDEYADIHTVAVISAIGNSIKLSNVGVMVFSNSEESIAAADWGIDDLVVANISKALSGRFAIKTAIYDPVAFSTQETGWGNNKVPVEKLVAALPDRDGVDAFVVVFPVYLEDPISMSSVRVRGLGLYRHSYGFRDVIVAYAFYDIAVVDAHTDKIIAEKYAGTGASPSFRDNLPWEGCSDSIWPETAATMTNNQKQALQTEIKYLVRRSLPWTISQLQLTGTVSTDAINPTPAAGAAANFCVSTLP
jgi:hypothetical protein